jgi:hypothetical protein
MLAALREQGQLGRATPPPRRMNPRPRSVPFLLVYLAGCSRWRPAMSAAAPSPCRFSHSLFPSAGHAHVARFQFAASGLGAGCWPAWSARWGVSRHLTVLHTGCVCRLNRTSYERANIRLFRCKRTSIVFDVDLFRVAFNLMKYAKKKNRSPASWWWRRSTICLVSRCVLWLSPAHKYNISVILTTAQFVITTDHVLIVLVCNLHSYLVQSASPHLRRVIIRERRLPSQPI